jgi:hypothetical protein
MIHFFSFLFIHEFKADILLEIIINLNKIILFDY